MNFDRKDQQRKERPTRRKTLEDSNATGKLNVSGDLDDDYYYRVVNDEKGRVNSLELRGYDVVKKSSGATMGDANPNEPGNRIEATGFYDNDTKAVLMRQPKVFREEDVAFKESKADKKEESIFRLTKEREFGISGEIKKE